MSPRVGKSPGVTRPDRNDGIVNAALMVLGVLAVVDNVLFHWLLAFHRFKQGWPGSIYVEVVLVVVGSAMVIRRVPAGAPVPQATVDHQMGWDVHGPGRHPLSWQAVVMGHGKVYGA